MATKPKTAAPKARRIHALITALETGAKINGAMRKEIIGALRSIEATKPDKPRKGGRRIAIRTFVAAALAKELIDKYGIKN